MPGRSDPSTQWSPGQPGGDSACAHPSHNPRIPSTSAGEGLAQPEISAGAEGVDLVTCDCFGRSAGNLQRRHRDVA